MLNFSPSNNVLPITKTYSPQKSSWCFYLVTFFLATLPSLHSLSFIASWYNEKRLAQITIFLLLTASLLTSKKLQISTANYWGSLLPSQKILISIFFICGLTSATQTNLTNWATMEIANYFLLALLSLYLAYSIYTESTDKLIIIALCTSASLYVVAFASTLLAGLISDVIDYHYLLSGFINRRFLNQFQSISFPILLVAPLIFNKNLSIKLGLILIAAFWFMLMLVSDGRGVLLASTSGIILSSLLLPANRKRWLLTSGVVIALGSLMYFVFDAILSTHEVIDSSTLRPGTGGRLPIWLEVIDVIRDNPLLGIGPMQLAFSPSDFTVAHPHNITLQLAAEWGIPAAICLIVLSLNGFLHWIKQQRQLKQSNESLISIALTSSFIASVIHGHLSGVFVMPLSQLSFAVIAGWMLAKYRVGQSNNKVNLAPRKCSLYIFPLLTMLALIMLIQGSYPQIKAMITSDYPENLYLNGEYPASNAPRFWSRTYIEADN